MECTARKIVSIVIAFSMVSAQLSAVVLPAAAGTPDDDLKQIQYKYYFRGKYDQAVPAFLTYLARTDLSADNRIAAREFLAASYVLSGDTASGQAEFSQLLSTHSGYSGPDPAVFKTDVLAVYERARDEYASTLIRTVPEEGTVAPAQEPAATDVPGKPLYKRWWLYAGLATALLIAGAVSREKEDGPVAARDTGTVVVGVRTQ